ncbi:MAG: DUF4430 domain-containing protein, partial [Actinobacteria bacterium]
LLAIPLIISTYFLISKAVNNKESQPNLTEPKLSTTLKKQKEPEKKALTTETNVNKAANKDESAEQGASKKAETEQKVATKTKQNQQPSPRNTKKISKKKSSKNIVKDKSDKCSVSLLVNKGASAKTYPTKLACSSTVFDLLKTASAQYGFSLKYKNYSFGVFITEIDGLKEDKASSMYWLYYINGNLANKGASEKKINEGDKILWKYEKTN